jgi:L-threonylcarbamoyladenylate synthase
LKAARCARISVIAPLRADLNSALKTDARGLRHFLQSGGVIAYPTESIFGLGCDPGNRRAVQRILRIKGRPQRKGLILIASHLAQLNHYIAPLNSTQIARISETHSKPHTWLVPSAEDCPKWITGRHKTIAVRITTHPLSASLCQGSGMALVSTSANRSGGRPVKTVRECYKLFGAQVKIIRGLVGKARKPSTIQDLASGKIIRP